MPSTVILILFNDMQEITITNSESRLFALQDILLKLSRSTDIFEIQAQLGAGIRELIPFQGLVSISKRNLSEGQYKITRLVQDISQGLIPANPWRDWDNLPAYTGGFINRATQITLPRVYQDFYLQDDPVLGDKLCQFGSCLVIPLFDQGDAINWNMLLRFSADGFTKAETELMFMMGNLMGRSTLNLIAARKVEDLNKRITAEIEQVATLQRSLLPERIPDIAGVTIKTHYKPCEQAGGDYYDFHWLIPDNESLSSDMDDSVSNALKIFPDGLWGIIIADVSGHGASAAVIMAMVQTLVHSRKVNPAQASPAKLLEFINAHLVTERLGAAFVTAFASIYNPADRSLKYACAGHYPPRVKSEGANAPVRELPMNASIPLGINAKNYKVADHTVQLEIGDTLILFTDGVIESFNPNKEMFGMQKLDETILTCSGKPDCVIGSLEAALLTHESGQRPADDQTIVAMKIIGR